MRSAMTAGSPAWIEKEAVRSLIQLKNTMFVKGVKRDTPLTAATSEYSTAGDPDLDYGGDVGKRILAKLLARFENYRYDSITLNCRYSCGPRMIYGKIDGKVQCDYDVREFNSADRLKAAIPSDFSQTSINHDCDLLKAALTGSNEHYDYLMFQITGKNNALMIGAKSDASVMNLSLCQQGPDKKWYSHTSLTRASGMKRSPFQYKALEKIVLEYMGLVLQESDTRLIFKLVSESNFKPDNDSPLAED